MAASLGEPGIQRRMPVLGGASIVGALLISLAIFGLLPAWMLVGVGGLLLVGVIDDAVVFRPLSKFFLESAVVVAVVWMAPRSHLTPWPVVTVAIEILWLLTTTNAFNLVDGLDGLASGVGIIAAAAAATVGIFHHDFSLAAYALAAAGALAGFLVYNFEPASIFMGDGGALPMGLLLGMVVLEAGDVATTHSRLPRYVFPVLVMLAPLMDTAIVSVSRLATGAAVSRRGLDHSHHRLLLLGLSVRRAVLVCWSVALLASAVGVAMTLVAHSVVVTTVPFVVLVTAVIGLFMVDLTFDSRPPGMAYGYTQGIARLILSSGYKRRLAEAALDLALIPAAYFGAFLLRLDFNVPEYQLGAMLHSLPAIMVASYAAFLVAGVYRGIWRYAGLSDLLRFANAAVLAGVLMVATSLVIPIDISGSIVVLFVLLVFNLLVGTRISFRALRRAVMSLALPSGRVLIVGAGQLGEVAARYVFSIDDHRLRLVGFADDDPFKLGKVVHGQPVLGSLDDLETIFGGQGFDQILVATDNASRERMAVVSEFARRHHLPVRRFSIGLDDLGVPADAASGLELSRAQVLS